MKCPCCGVETPNDRVFPQLWDYEAFMVFVKNYFTDDFKKINKYDLEHYFMKVRFSCKGLDTWDKILDKISFYILSDEGSNGKFPVKMGAVVKQDITSVAYSLVDYYRDWIKSFNKRDVDELVPIIKSRFSDKPEWNNPSFELYVEKALKYYKLAD